MTPNNFFNTNPVLAAIHLFIWLLWRPSVWQTQVVETIAPTLNSDFALMNLSAAQWRQPTVWRLLTIVYGVAPLLVRTIVGLVSMLISQNWVLALRGIIYVVTLSLVGGLLSGAGDSVVVISLAKMAGHSLDVPKATSNDNSNRPHSESLHYRRTVVRTQSRVICGTTRHCDPA